MFKLRRFALALASLAILGLILSMKNASLTHLSLSTVSFSLPSVHLTLRPGQTIFGNSVSERGQTWDEIVKSPPVKADGVAMSTLIGNVNEIGFRTYSMPEQQTIMTKFYMWYPETNLNINPLNVRLIALLDERQLPDFFIEPYKPAIQPKIYNDIVLIPGDNREIPIKIPAEVTEYTI